MSSLVGVGRGPGLERGTEGDANWRWRERCRIWIAGLRGLAFLGNVVWIWGLHMDFLAIRWGSCVLHWLGYLGTTNTDNAAFI